MNELPHDATACSMLGGYHRAPLKVGAKVLGASMGFILSEVGVGGSVA